MTKPFQWVKCCGTLRTWSRTVKTWPINQRSQIGEVEGNAIALHVSFCWQSASKINVLDNRDVSVLPTSANRKPVISIWWWLEHFLGFLKVRLYLTWFFLWKHACGCQRPLTCLCSALSGCAFKLCPCKVPKGGYLGVHGSPQIVRVWQYSA